MSIVVSLLDSEIKKEPFKKGSFVGMVLGGLLFCWFDVDSGNTSTSLINFYFKAINEACFS